MDRRSFVLSLFGGLAATGVAGSAFAKSATQGPAMSAALAAQGDIDAATSTRLDGVEAEHSQVVIRERVVRRGPRRGPWRRRRPVVVRRRVIRRGPRRVIR